MERAAKSEQPESAAELESDASELERLKEDLKRTEEMCLRAIADFDNYRKRVERDRSASIKAGKADLIKSILGVVDSFQRALKHMEGADDSVMRGLEAINRQLLSVLEGEGVVPYDSLYQPFDAALHEAVGSVKTGDHPSGFVVEEVSKGYRWGKDVFRPAQVFVEQ